MSGTMRSERARDQRGLTLMEVLMAAGIGMLLVASGGFLFVGQVRGYNDLGAQARLQTMTKSAVLSMNTEIANTGASLSDRRYNFVMLPNRFQFAYVDLKARHCASTDTVTISYYVSSGASGDSLMAKTICNKGKPSYNALIKGLGAVQIDFAYYDFAGHSTTTASKVKAVEFDLDVKSKAGKSLFVRNRNPKIRVEMLN